MKIQLYEGDVADRLKDIPCGSINCIVTSPPYYRQRYYDCPGEIGWEESPQEFVDKLVMVGRQLREVLRPDGVFWLNIGDSYTSGGRGAWCGFNKKMDKALKAEKPPKGMRPKNLVGIPWRLALALQDDGWNLRSECVWLKENYAPETATDRPHRAHEHIYLFSKNLKYYYDNDAIREPHNQVTIDRAKTPVNIFGGSATGVKLGKGDLHGGQMGKIELNPKGKNHSTIFKAPTGNYKGLHFACYPESLIEPLILAGCPENGAVLDPFGGSGTTAMVAVKNNRNCILIESKPEYCEMIKKRVINELPLIAQLEVL